MAKRPFMVYLIGVGFMLWLFVFVAIARTFDPGPSELPKAYFVREDGKVRIYQQDTMGPDWDHPKPFAVAIYMPERKTGPVPYLIEFYETKQMYTHPEGIYISEWEGELSEDEIGALRSRLLDYARNDPGVYDYHPGQRPVTRFSPRLTVWTLLRCALIFMIPILPMRLSARSVTVPPTSREW